MPIVEHGAMSGSSLQWKRKVRIFYSYATYFYLLPRRRRTT
jgi:hypothetical protein